MKSLYRARPKNSQESITWLKAYFEETSSHYQGFQVRCVLYSKEPDQDPSHLGICMVRGYPEKPSSEESRRYDEFLFLDDWIEKGEFQEFLSDLEASILKVGGRQLEFSKSPHFDAQPIQPSLNELSESPGALFSIEADKGNPLLRFDDQPLLDFSLPFSTVFEAIADWIGHGSPLTSSHHWLRKIVIFLPECRAYFQRLKVKNDQLLMQVARKIDKPLRIKGYLKTANREVQIERDVSDEVLIEPWPESTEAVKLFLIDSNLWIYDHHDETPPRSPTGRRRLLIGVYSDFVKQIQEGEGLTTEFKRWVKPEPGRMWKVIETTAAYANCRGGRIFVGVDDSCQPVGIEREICEKYGCGLEEALTRYKGDLRQRITEKLTKTPELGLKHFQHRGKTILVIEVEPHTERPVRLDRGNEIFIRRGASTRQPDNEELKQLLCDTSGFSHSSGRQRLPR